MHSPIREWHRSRITQVYKLGHQYNNSVIIYQCFRKHLPRVNLLKRQGDHSFTGFLMLGCLENGFGPSDRSLVCQNSGEHGGMQLRRSWVLPGSMATDDVARVDCCLDLHLRDLCLWRPVRSTQSHSYEECYAKSSRWFAEDCISLGFLFGLPGPWPWRIFLDQTIRYGTALLWHTPVH